MMDDVVRLNLGKVRGASSRRKAKKAVNEVKRQVSSRTGVDDVRVANSLNERLWERGASSPPRRVDVRIVEERDHVRAEDADVDRDESPTQEASTDTQEEDEAQDEEADDFSAIDDDVREVLEEGTIGDGKEAVKELNKADFELLLNFEEKHQNRKGMKKFLRSNMR
ncbi:MAG: hypothetical protein SV186_03625 [Candidatus Nanohaloarchaea archaeon]|nr:hypothetical protein [Candidatus Nanohaloarchaea archaeon]